MAPDAHCHVAKAFYSVPSRLIGSQLQVCIKENMVQFFFKGEEIVKTHPRVPPGKTQTDFADLHNRPDAGLRACSGLRRPQVPQGEEHPRQPDGRTAH
ncbi:MAG: hypothetical protein QME70_07935 [Bacillota bacterium]|nr:hypothetical protein [Bacillota bacterium]